MFLMEICPTARQTKKGKVVLLFSYLVSQFLEKLFNDNLMPLCPFLVLLTSRLLKKLTHEMYF